jgi:hypothetical protein
MLIFLAGSATPSMQNKGIIEENQSGKHMDGIQNRWLHVMAPASSCTGQFAKISVLPLKIAPAISCTVKVKLTRKITVLPLKVSGELLIQARDLLVV